MSISDRVMTSPRARPSAALRVAVSGRQAAAQGLGRQSACRGAVHDHLAAGHDNVACPNSANRP